MKYLFLYTISPVQSFIAEARKAQDLYSGSKMLSDLMDATIKEAVARSNSFELIFPSSEVERKPNRFIAILDIEENLKDFGEKLKAFTNSQLLTWADEYLLKVIEVNPRLQNKAAFYQSIRTNYGSEGKESRGQLNDFLEVYWVGQTYTTADAYNTHFGKLEQYLGAAKSMRDFGQFEETGRKCTMNGNYNVRFYRKNEREGNYFVKNKLFRKQEDVLIMDYDKNPVVHLDNKNKTLTVKQLQEGEGLSAISFLKRLYKVHEIEMFPSTAKVALYHTTSKLSAELEKEWIAYETSFKKHNEEFDYQYYFEENLVKKRIKNKNFLKDRKKTHIDLKRGLNKEKLKLNSYYALLHFDGDQMGKILSGAKLKDPNKHDLKQFQKDLSEKLGLFSKWVYQYLNEKEKGKTVYAGGDDFLGFVNLNYLFEVLQILQKGFDEQVNQVIQRTLGYELQVPLSFSAGINIAHYKEPLSIVIGNANAAEKIAKEETKGDRNSCCIFASKHSGEMHQTWFKWQYFQESTIINPLEIAETLWQLLATNKLSNKFIHNLALTFRPLVEEGGKDEGYLAGKFAAPFALELKRLMKRAIIDEKETSKIIDFSNQLFNLLKASDYHLENFLQFLFIVDFIYRNTNPIAQNQNT